MLKANLDKLLWLSPEKYWCVATNRSEPEALGGVCVCVSETRVEGVTRGERSSRSMAEFYETLKANSVHDVCFVFYDDKQFGLLKKNQKKKNQHPWREQVWFQDSSVNEKNRKKKHKVREKCRHSRTS